MFWVQVLRVDRDTYLSQDRSGVLCHQPTILLLKALRTCCLMLDTAIMGVNSNSCPLHSVCACVQTGTLFSTECTTFAPKLYRPWSKVVCFKGNMVPFGTQPVFERYTGHLYSVYSDTWKNTNINVEVFAFSSDTGKASSLF